ncbi:uncharacterized protein PHACADRAFT_92789, partial [Phanerochaete carnosa HHB-10118-sp]
QLICVPFGTCEPCPESALHQPFCQPFGNRRLMHCISAPSSSPNSNAHPPQQDSRPPSYSQHDSTQPPPPLHDHAPFDAHRGGETPAWESCGRIVPKERGDFYEFLACNLGIALVAIGAVFVRSKRLQAMHARQLAVRIGLVRPTPGGWGEG